MNTEPSTNSVRRFARTLQEAFGPHTDNRVEPKPLTPEERSAQDNRELAAVGILCVLTLVAALFIVFTTSTQP